MGIEEKLELEAQNEWENVLHDANSKIKQYYDDLAEKGIQTLGLDGDEPVEIQQIHSNVKLELKRIQEKYRLLIDKANQDDR